ncbi:MAG: MATE family efflux transporter, partial [Candidatus Marinimicrobia bacterium]|nr:MATE family efflux transporter [Candidatus Neomarinimicrobiota bacterium]
ETSIYLKYRSFGIFFAMGNMVFRAFYVGLTKTKVITWSTFVMAAVNIILDYILIFGKLGAPELGVAGAAIASVIAEATALIYFIIYTFVTVKFSDYNLFKFYKPELARLYSILKIAIPIMLQQFLSLSVWFVFFLLIEKIGEMALAVSNIIRSIYVILMIPIWGFATATNTLVSYVIGLGKEDEVISLVYKIAGLTLIGVIGIVSIGLLFPNAILSIYTNDPILIEMGRPALKIVSVGVIFVGLGFIFFNGISGTGRTDVSLSLEVIVLAIYLLYTYILIFIFDANVTLAWSSEIVYGLLLSIVSIIYLIKGNWKNNNI